MLKGAVGFDVFRAEKSKRLKLQRDSPLSFIFSRMKVPPNGLTTNSEEGEKKSINSELWHACAGPLVSLPPVGSLVIYFPQGHSEQVAASMQKQTDFIPNYPNLPSKLICILHNVSLHVRESSLYQRHAI
uniref:Auxin response factor n=1 Tax=Rhizophora mucronata TaxID=61149 RepID=A0A2P2M9S3_RHIMU